jgi:hypothetical protein
MQRIESLSARALAFAGDSATIATLSVLAGGYCIMWWTPEGERILLGAEAELLPNALGFVADHVRDDQNGDWEFGISTFDGLQHGQKLSVLAQIGRALLCEDEPAVVCCL